MIHRTSGGYSVLEVVVAIFIFGCISTAILKFVSQVERLRGRALFLQSASSLAASEAERLRNIAVQNGVFEDSIFTQELSGRTFSVNRHIVESHYITSPLPRPIEPVEVELTVSDALHADVKPLHFKMLTGNDQP